MLEIKNVVKTYRPKKGVPVRALDDVSLSFDSKGLVFILGKSGSGKSTLLNVIGGLDKVDKGEFVIKGKSSKEFSQGDFDAYRNTFIGFIFQEYNILNEFNVGQNIALAMELQGKRATKEALKNILEEVDLPGYEMRKPNELSGGQKQRIAIARALIKEPEIIMADEPTGALDSNTGKQVFDTLKKLSKNKLVIVVSHDREFAEYYGDRVIELADGKIISDISKYEAAPDMKSETLSIIDNKIVHINKGTSLTEKDFDIIREFIRKNEGNILISSDERSNSSFKQMAMISDDGKKASFQNTALVAKEPKKYLPNEAKFIRSRLPYRNSLKIGASSLKTKPIRLFFTILLSVVAFALFGLADTFGSYDKYTTAQKSISELDVTYAAFSLKEEVIYTYNDSDYYISYEDAMGDDSSLEELKELVGIDLFPVYRGINTTNYGGPYLDSLVNAVYADAYYLTSMAGITELGENELNKMGYTITGRMPQSDDEIAITQYQFEMYKKYGFRPAQGGNDITDENLTADNNEQTGILGKHMFLRFSSSDYNEVLNNVSFKIVGIVDTKIDSKYDYLKGQSSGGIIDYVIINEFQNIITKGIHGMMFVNPGLITKTIKENTENTIGIKYGGCFCIKPLQEYSYYSNSREITRVVQLKDINLNEVVWTGSEKTQLAATDIIIPMGFYQSILNAVTYVDYRFRDYEFYTSTYDYETEDFEKMSSQSFGSYDVSSYNNSFIYALKTDVIVRYVKENDVPDWFKNWIIAINPQYEQAELTDAQWKMLYIDHLRNWEYVENNEIMKMGANIEINSFLQFFKENNYFNLAESIKLNGNTNYSATWEGDLVNVVGFQLDFTGNGYNDSTAVVSSQIFNSVTDKTNDYYSMFIGTMPQDAAAVDKIIRFSYDGSSPSGTKYTLENQVMVALDNVNQIVEDFSSVFLYLGLGLAVFSGLLLANFIAVSIANKRREIGILRAVGAKSRDVFTIFFNESLIIALINFAIALVGTITACILLNNMFMNQVGISISILSFGVRQIILMLAVSVGVALVASFIPVMSIARKQPIDSIQER